MTDNCEAVAEALRALGAAYRGDWNDFDGRTLRAELNTLASHLAPDAEPVTYGALCIPHGICPESRRWTRYCPEAEGHWCPHMEAAAAARSGTVPTPSATAAAADVDEQVTEMLAQDREEAEGRALAAERTIEEIERIAVGCWNAAPDEGYDAILRLIRGDDDG